MLCIYSLRHWFNLSDPAAEEALWDSRALRRFAGVDLGCAPAPDETTILLPLPRLVGPTANSFAHEDVVPVAAEPQRTWPRKPNPGNAGGRSPER